MVSYSLTEPNVLRAAKQALTDETTSESGYFVTDTQFSTENWLGGTTIPDQLKADLAPFNHVKVGSGYPDLIGAGQLSDGYYRGNYTEAKGAPLIVVEAKGFDANDEADPESGVVQAHDRLQEANIALVATPESTVTEQTRALARELNVGILSVANDSEVDLLEKPRIVGTQVGDDATAIQLQAGLQGVAGQSFGLNRPKNYLGYPFSVYHSESTKEVLSEYVVDDYRNARKGAAFLGLVNLRPNGDDTLTPLGNEVVRFGLRHYDSIDAVLSYMESWKGKRERLVELAPKWGLLARWIVFSYPATQLIVSSIEEIEQEDDVPKLPKLVQCVYDQAPTFAVEFFIRGDAESRAAVLDSGGYLNVSALENDDIYRSVTTYQFKQMLYHSGIVSESGSDSSNLEPTEDVWSLETPLQK